MGVWPVHTLRAPPSEGPHPWVNDTLKFFIIFQQGDLCFLFSMGSPSYVADPGNTILARRGGGDDTEEVEDRLPLPCMFSDKLYGLAAQRGSTEMVPLSPEPQRNWQLNVIPSRC